MFHIQLRYYKLLIIMVTIVVIDVLSVGCKETTRTETYNNIFFTEEAQNKINYHTDDKKEKSIQGDQIKDNKELKYTDADFEGIVNNFKLEKDWAYLHSSFSNTEIGKKVASIILLQRILTDNTPQMKMFKEYSAELQSKPGECFHEITKGMCSFTPEYSLERQFLINFAADLDVNHKDKWRFLSNELSRPMQVDSRGELTDDFFIPIIALRSMSKVKKNSKELADELRSSFNSVHKSNKSREALLDELASLEPQIAKQLCIEFGVAKNIK